MGCARVFIGKGLENDNHGVIEVTCPLEDLPAMPYESEGAGKAFLLSVAGMRLMGEFGLTHTVYYFNKDRGVRGPGSYPEVLEAALEKGSKGLRTALV